MKFLLPLIIILVGAAAGGAAGYFLTPDISDLAPECACETAVETDGEAGGETDDHGAPEHAEEGGEDFEYVTLTKQFVVPIIENQAMAGMVVMSLALEITPENKETIYAKEPKLRDEFLNLLFSYANAGGFAGNYLEANDLKLVRADLTAAAKGMLGPIVNEVLIVDLVRQDL